MPSAEQHWAFFLGLGLSWAAASFGSARRCALCDGERHREVTPDVRGRTRPARIPGESLPGPAEWSSGGGAPEAGLCQVPRRPPSRRLTWCGPTGFRVSQTSPPGLEAH